MTRHHFFFEAHQTLTVCFLKRPQFRVGSLENAARMVFGSAEIDQAGKEVLDYEGTYSKKILESASPVKDVDKTGQPTPSYKVLYRNPSIRLVRLTRELPKTESVLRHISSASGARKQHGHSTSARVTDFQDRMVVVIKKKKSRSARK